MSVSALAQVALPVVDVDRAVAFYRDTLGVPLVATFGSLAFFDLGGVRLLLERTSNADETRTTGSALYFDVPDVHAARADLARRGVAFDQEPHLVHRDDAGTFGRPGAETWMAFFRDPDGNQLAIACSDQRAS